MPYSMPDFHGYYDVLVNPYRYYTPETGWTTTTEKKHITVVERELSYRFYAHFHPYVAELVRRLNRRSIRGLQAADTKYRQNEDAQD